MIIYGLDKKNCLCLLLKSHNWKAGSTTAQHPNINPSISPLFTTLFVQQTKWWFMDLTKKIVCACYLSHNWKAGSTTAQHPNINPFIHPSITVLPVAVDSLWPNSSSPFVGGVLVAVGSLWATLTQFFRWCKIFFQHKSCKDPISQ
jgi:hypothetical protein